MSLYQCHTGINITGDKLQLVEIEYKDEEIYLSCVEEEYFEEFLTFTNKETKVNSLIQKAFDEIILRKKLKNNIVSFSLPLDIFNIVELPFDHSLIKADLIDQFKWEFSVLYPQKVPAEYLIQYVEIPVKDKNEFDKAIAIAAKKKQIQSIHKFCVRNNLKLKYIDFTHMASNNLLQLDKKNPLESLCISLFATGNYYSFMFLDKGIPLFFDVKNINSISEILPRLSESFEKLNNRGMDIGSIENFYLTGNNLPDGLAANIQKTYEIEFNLINPFTGINIAEDIDNRFIERDYTSFSPAAGMALRLI